MIMDIIKRISDLMNEQKWSVNSLAMEADLTQSTLSSIMSRNSLPKIDTLQRICKAFGISMAQFFWEDEQTEAVDEQERQLLHRFRELSPKKRQALLELLSPPEKE